MFVFCEECRNHYDDEAQAKKCVNRTHLNIKPSPIDSHVDNTKAANHRRRTLVVGVKGGAATVTTPLRVVPAPTADAEPLPDTSPTPTQKRP